MVNLIKILVYLLIFLFPFGMLFRVEIFTNIKIIPQDIVVFSIFLLSVFYFFDKRMKNEFRKFFIFQGLFILTGVLVLIVNSVIFGDINILASFLYPVRYIMYLSLLSLGPLFAKDRFIGKAIILSGLIFLILGFVQFFRFNDLKPLFSLGWDDHLYRLFSTMLDPNYSGVIYTLYFFIFLNSVLQNKLVIIYKELLISFFTIIAIFITYSRTALVALVAGIVSYQLITRKFKILLILGLVFIVLLSTVSDTSVEGLNPFRTASSSDRLISVTQAGKIIQESKLVGVGFNAYRDAQIRYGMRHEEGASMSNADAGTDSSILFVTATTGIIGVFFYLLSYFYLLKTLFVNKKQNLIFICMVISLFFASFFLNVLFYTPILTLLFLTLALRRNLIRGSK